MKMASNCNCNPLAAGKNGISRNSYSYCPIHTLTGGISDDKVFYNKIIEYITFYWFNIRTIVDITTVLVNSTSSHVRGRVNILPNCVDGALFLLDPNDGPYHFLAAFILEISRS